MIKRISRSLVTGWTVPRIFRLVMGIAALVFGIIGRDMLLSAAGGFLALMAVLNSGCCGVGGCSVPARGEGGSCQKH